MNIIWINEPNFCTVFVFADLKLRAAKEKREISDPSEPNVGSPVDVIIDSPLKSHQ